MKQTPFDNISPAQHKALETLAKYRYVTPKQFALAGVSDSVQYIRRAVLSSLHNRVRGNLIDCADMGFEPGQKKKSRVYFLTEHGAKIIADYERREVSEIPYPKGGVQYARDYYHREAYIDYLIYFHRWIEKVDGRVFTEKHYFDSQGSNRKGTQAHAQTRINLKEEFIVPDGLADFEAGGTRRAVAVEIHRHTDPKRCVEQLEAHMRAVRAESVVGRFGRSGPSAVFSVATDPSLSERIRARMLEIPEFREHFARFPIFRFASLDAVRADYGTAWVLADGKPAPLA
jgi:hypothetical protein